MEYGKAAYPDSCRRGFLDNALCTCVASIRMSIMGYNNSIRTSLQGLLGLIKLRPGRPHASTGSRECYHCQTFWPRSVLLEEQSHTMMTNTANKKNQMYVCMYCQILQISVK